MKKILVTGGAGFIGSILCDRLLELEYQVLNVDNFNNYYDPALKWRNISQACKKPGYSLVKADIRDQKAMEEIFKNHQIDVVVHLAALAGVRNSIENPTEYADVDITGTINLLECSWKYNVGKFVFASSSSVYGNIPTPFCEDSRVDIQQSPYAAAKLAGEQFCRVYHKLYKLPVVCLRFFTVFGERQRPEMAIHKLTRQIDANEVIQIYGDGNSFRDYTYVSDIINGIVASVELTCGFEIINLGSENEIKLIDLVNLIGKKMNKVPEIRFVNMQKGDVNCTRANIEKAARLLGYRPQFTFEEGLEQFIKWYNKNKSLLIEKSTSRMLLTT